MSIWHVFNYVFLQLVTQVIFVTPWVRFRVWECGKGSIRYWAVIVSEELPSLPSWVASAQIKLNETELA